MKNIQQHATVLSTTANMWTSEAKDGYLGITVHYLSEQMVMHSNTVRVKHLPGHHTGEAMASVIKEVLALYNKPLFTQTNGI